MSAPLQLEHLEGLEERARTGIVWPLPTKPRAAALARVLGREAQRWEDLLHAVQTSTALDVAEGVHLDQWGDLVDEPRGPLSDAQYRPFIRARILANRCNGTPDELIEILKLVAAPYSVIQWVPLLPAGFVLQVVRYGWMPEVQRRRVRRLFDLIQPAGRTMELYEGVVGAFAEDSSYAAPGGYISRII